MDFLYRQVRLSLLKNEDVSAALSILYGRSTVSQVAEDLSQDYSSFDGDGDVLVLSYSREAMDENSSTQMNKAQELMGAKGDELVKKFFSPAIATSKARIEIVFRYCNLSEESVFDLADAFAMNSSFVGFNVVGNPGNDSVLGETALERACIETMAPIVWFQGTYLSDRLLEARQELSMKRLKHTMSNESLSPRTKIAELVRIQRSNANDLNESAEDLIARRKNQNINSNPTEDQIDRQRWCEETREMLRQNHRYSEDDIEAIIVNLELLQLQKTIDNLIFSRPKGGAMFASPRRQSQKNERQISAN